MGDDRIIFSLIEACPLPFWCWWTSWCINIRLKCRVSQWSHHFHPVFDWETWETCFTCAACDGKGVCLETLKTWLDFPWPDIITEWDQLIHLIFPVKTKRAWLPVLFNDDWWSIPKHGLDFFCDMAIFWDLGLFNVEHFGPPSDCSERNKAGWGQVLP